MIPRLTGMATVLAAVSLVPAAPADKPTLRIVSPANGAVVRPGQKLMVKLTGAGDYVGVLVGGEVAMGVIDAPLGKPPWTVLVEFSSETEPGKAQLAALGRTVSGEDVASNSIEIDVEPVEIPPVEFSPSALIIPLGGCIAVSDEASAVCQPGLRVWGIHADGTRVSLNRSTRIKFVSQSPSVTTLNRDGTALLGLSRGSTKVVVFGKYTVDVAVR
ncbi:MAG TPA: hypothetical protein VN841_29385 [Bryobacteraceae bacterium]|nr:hypothetical protein [Bryobacteraceae bacterium]